MKPRKVAEAIARGLDGDFAGWERFGKHWYDSGHRIALGHGFVLETEFIRTTLFLYSGTVSFEMELDDADPGEGVFSGDGWRAEFRRYRGPREDIILDPGETERLMRLVYLEDESVLEGGGVFDLADGLVLTVSAGGDGPGHDAILEYTTRDGDVRLTARGRLHAWSRGMGFDGFVLRVDAGRLRSFMETNHDPSTDTARWLEEHPFAGAPEAASAKIDELRMALDDLRSGSRRVRRRRRPPPGGDQSSSRNQSPVMP